MSKKKTALVTGIRGQDAAYLAELLLNKGYHVIGADRRSGEASNWRLKSLGILDDIEIVYLDLLELTNIHESINRIKPDEVYNLAAQSFVGSSFSQPLITTDINAMGVLRLLEVLRTLSPGSKFYQASTSEMFGRVRETPQSEETPFYPRSPYGCSKVFSHWITVNYRESYDMFACSGILFNHESPLRGLEFVTRKITYGVARIIAGVQEKITLGNLNAKRDWGFAKEYVEGMWLMLQQQKPDDYVLATGETRTVREFVSYAFEAAGIQIEWQGEEQDEKGINKKTGRVVVEVSPEFFRPAEVELLVGNPEKAKMQLGWSPKTSLSQLVALMVEADIALVNKELE